MSVIQRIVAEPRPARLIDPLVSVPEPLTRVTVVDIDMPLGSMVTFMVKWAIAAIPAFLILFVLFIVLAGAITSIGQ